MGLSFSPTLSSYQRWIKATIVLFPEPEGPTIAVVFPDWNVRDTLLNTL
jgi:hypothetical protein